MQLRDFSAVCVTTRVQFFFGPSMLSCIYKELNQMLYLSQIYIHVRVIVLFLDLWKAFDGVNYFFFIIKYSTISTNIAVSMYMKGIWFLTKHIFINIFFRSHMKQHKVVNTKLVPLVHTKNNVDEDTFLVVPKSSVPRGRFISRRYVKTFDKID